MSDNIQTKAWEEDIPTRGWDDVPTKAWDEPTSNKTKLNVYQNIASGKQEFKGEKLKEDKWGPLIDGGKKPLGDRTRLIDPDWALKDTISSAVGKPADMLTSAFKIADFAQAVGQMPASFVKGLFDKALGYEWGRSVREYRNDTSLLNQLKAKGIVKEDVGSAAFDKAMEVLGTPAHKAGELVSSDPNNWARILTEDAINILTFGIAAKGGSAATNINITKPKPAERVIANVPEPPITPKVEEPIAAGPRPTQGEQLNLFRENEGPVQPGRPGMEPMIQQELFQKDPLLDKPIDPAAAEFGVSNKMVPETPVREPIPGQLEIPFEQPKGSTPDMFAPMEAGNADKVMATMSPEAGKPAAPMDQMSGNIQAESMLPQGKSREDAYTRLATENILERPIKLSSRNYFDPNKIQVPRSQRKNQGGWVKLPGGNWHPDTASKIANFLRPDANDMLYYLNRQKRKELHEWTERISKNYVNKYFGTERDPLKDLEIIVEGTPIRWEELTDNIIGAKRAEYYADANKNSLSEMQGLKKLGEESPNVSVYGIGSLFPKIKSENELAYRPSTAMRMFENYLFHVSDYIRNHIPIDQLERYDFTRLIREVVEQDRRQAKAMEKARATGEGTTLVKKYDDGMQWVEVKSEAALKNEGDVMGHCVGGYCEMVRNGESRILSLRDEKHNSHVTIELIPRTVSSKWDYEWPIEREWAQAKDQWDIVQIKGKQNAKPASKYISYIQDLIKSGKYKVKGDLENADMEYISYKQYGENRDYYLEKKLGGEGYYTKEEIKKALAELSKGPGKYQSGSIDLSAFADVGKKLAQLAGKAHEKWGPGFTKIPPDVQKRLDNVITRYDSLGEAVEAYRTGKETVKIQDLSPLTKPFDVLSVMAGKQANQVITTYLNEARYNVTGLANIRFAKLQEMTEPFNNLPNKSKGQIALAMTDINTIKWQKWLEENNLKEIPDNVLKEQWHLTDFEISVVKTMRVAMRYLKALDDFASNVLREKTWISDRIKDYWPTSRGGNYMIQVLDGDGKLAWLKGAESLKEMKKIKKEAEAAFKDQKVEINEIIPPKEVGDLEGLYLKILQQTAYENAQGIAKNPRLKEIGLNLDIALENRKRAFEKSRLNEDVPGIVGRNADRSMDFDALMKVYHDRLYSSYQFHTFALAVDRLLNPIRDPANNAWLAKNAPNTLAAMEHIAAKMLGKDWSIFRDNIEKWPDDGWNHINKILKGYDGNVQLTKRGKINAASAALGNTGALWALLGNGAYLLQQAVAAPSVHLFAFREAAIKRISAPRAAYANLLATMETWAVLGNEIGAALYNRTNLDVNAKPAGYRMKWLKDQNDMGFFAAHLLDDLLPDVNKYRTWKNEPLEKAVAETRKATSDPIEIGSNIYAQTYFYFYWKELLPTLKDKEIKELAHKSAVAVTGDYKKYDTPAIWDKAGPVKHWAGKFAQWGHTKLSLEHENIVATAQWLKSIGKEGAATPFLWSMAAWYALGGLIGMPVLSDYEPIRRIWNNYLAPDAAYQMPPFELLLSEMGIPEKFHGGLITDYIGQQLFDIDIASGQSARPLFTLGSVGPQMFPKAWHAGKFLAKKIDKHAEWFDKESPWGPNYQEKRAAQYSVPTALQGMVTQYFGGMDGKNVLSRFGDPVYSIRDDREKILNLLNIKTIRQRKERRENEALRSTVKAEEAKSRNLSITLRDAIIAGDEDAAWENRQRLIDFYLTRSNGDQLLALQAFDSQMNNIIEAVEREAKNRKGVPKDLALESMATTTSVGKMLRLANALRRTDTMRD